MDEGVMMGIVRRFMLFAGFIFAVGFSSVMANSFALIDQSSVHIVCTDRNGAKKSIGSGVVINNEGLVLTAKHVVIAGKGDLNLSEIRCKGSIGTAFGANEDRKLTIIMQSSGLDAALLKFIRKNGEKFTHLKAHCSTGAGLKRRTIYATGFPNDETNNTPSSRRGVISTTEPANASQLITVDSFVSRGMSGGVVTLEESADIVGIIAGATFDPGTGHPNAYAILPVYSFAHELNLQEKISCEKTHKSMQPISWVSGKSPSEMPIDMNADEGFCFITSVFGEFNSKEDYVKIILDQNNKYRIKGSDELGGGHGAEISCFYK